MLSAKSNRKQGRKITRMIALGVLVLILAPAAWPAAKPQMRAKRKVTPLPPVDVTKLVWPLPPRVARISYVTQVIGERDLLGIKPKKAGWLERAAGVSVQDQERPRLKKPYGVAVDSKGLIYVADSGQHKVFVFDLEKKQLSYRGDGPPARFEVMIGLAIDDQDRLFVSDAKLHQITCFDAKGKFLAVFGESALLRPAGMAVDNELRRLYVTDVTGARLAIFDLDTFKFTRYINSQPPSKEEPHGLLGTPTNVAVNADGLVYVVDTIPNRVEVFDTDGNYVRGFGEQGNLPGSFARPKGIAIDSDGHVYVADSEFNNFQIFTPEGRPLMVVGNFGPQPGQFLLLTGLAFDKRNRLVVTDGGALPRVEVFHYTTDAEAQAAEGKEKTNTAGGDDVAAKAKAAAGNKNEPE
jgi:DNA-binding beta-propeller fold protein YncE